MKKLTALVLLLSLASCTTLTTLEKHKIAELEAQGVRVPHEEMKNPGVAGGLNVLPGFGNFYLAIGTNESEQWAYGFINLLLWPISIVWGLPEAAIDADNINKRNTVYYYTYGVGKDTLRNNAVSAPPQPAPAMPVSATTTPINMAPAVTPAPMPAISPSPAPQPSPAQQ